ncbi:hypothetical protein ACFE04_020496 [Oxalis oulophora]
MAPGSKSTLFGGGVTSASQSQGGSPSFGCPNSVFSSSTTSTLGQSSVFTFPPSNPSPFISVFPPVRDSILPDAPNGDGNMVNFLFDGEKSFEELRWQDYKLRGSTNHTPLGSSSPFFGCPNVASQSQGVSVFGISSSPAVCSNTTSSVGQSANFGNSGSSSSGFSFSSSPSLFSSAAASALGQSSVFGNSGSSSSPFVSTFSPSSSSSQPSFSFWGSRNASDSNPQPTFGHASQRDSSLTFGCGTPASKFGCHPAFNFSSTPSKIFNPTTPSPCFMNVSPAFATSFDFSKTPLYSFLNFPPHCPFSPCKTPSIFNKLTKTPSIFNNLTTPSIFNKVQSLFTNVTGTSGKNQGQFTPACYWTALGWQLLPYPVFVPAPLSIFNGRGESSWNPPFGSTICSCSASQLSSTPPQFGSSVSQFSSSPQFGFYAPPSFG